MIGALTAVVLLAANPLRLHDHRIDEASGIGLGIRSPGVYYVQNDSGDNARFFAVDKRTGRTRAVYHVPGATNVDWEDLAVAPDPAGTPSVWLADIGDNDAVRSEIDLYRVDEPRVDMSRYGATVTTGRPDVWRLRYPSGPVNAESLAVTPTGHAYVITKVDSGRSTVYKVPLRPDAHRVRTLRKVASIRLRSHGGLIPGYLQRLATGAAIDPSGRLLVVRTYTDAYVWRVRNDDVAAALRAAPQHVTIPLQQQGEGVCFDGNALVLDSEGVGTPIVTVPLRLRGRPTPGPSGTASTAPATGSSSAVHTPSPSAGAHPSGERSSGGGFGGGAGVTVVVIAVIAAGIGYRQLRRRE